MEMATLLSDIESTLNQRPLTYLGSDPANPLPITPAHLALGRALESLPPSREDSSVKMTRRYNYLKTTLNHFWKRWSSEYLPTLIARKRWHQETRVPKEGDVCLITEENVSRPKWQLGRIVETYRGQDGLVRTFKLKTAKGVIMRPIQRLHLLEPDDIEYEMPNEDGDEATQIEDRQELMLVNPLVDQGPQDVPTREDPTPTTTTRFGRQSFPPVRFSSHN